MNKLRQLLATLRKPKPPTSRYVIGSAWFYRTYRERHGHDYVGRALPPPLRPGQRLTALDRLDRSGAQIMPYAMVLRLEKERAEMLDNRRKQ